jgi:hypothetical protein
MMVTHPLPVDFRKYTHTHPQDLHIMSLTSLAVMNQTSALPVLITIVGTGIDKLYPVVHIYRVGTG